MKLRHQKQKSHVLNVPGMDVMFVIIKGIHVKNIRHLHSHSNKRNFKYLPMKIFSIFLSALILSGSYVTYASHNSVESSLPHIRINNLSEKNSNYKYVKSIKARSRMGNVENYDLYRDADDNYCVKSKYSKGYASLSIHNEDGWSHSFIDGTTWYCNVY